MNNNGLICTSTSKLFNNVKSELHEFARKHPLLDYGKLDLTNRENNSDDSSSSHTSDDSSSNSSDEELDNNLSLDSVFTDTGRLIESPGPLKMSSEAWAELLRKYAKSPSNVLEKDRDSYFNDRHRGKTIDILDCRTEADLLIYQRQR